MRLNNIQMLHYDTNICPAIFQTIHIIVVTDKGTFNLLISHQRRCKPKDFPCQARCRNLKKCDNLSVGLNPVKIDCSLRFNNGTKMQIRATHSSLKYLCELVFEVVHMTFVYRYHQLVNFHLYLMPQILLKYIDSKLVSTMMTYFCAISPHTKT